MRAEWWGWGSLQRRLRVEEAGTSGGAKRRRCCPAPLRVQSQGWGLPGCDLPQWALRAPGERTKVTVRPRWVTAAWTGRTAVRVEEISRNALITKELEG